MEHLLQREKPETIAADCCINSMGLRLKNDEEAEVLQDLFHITPEMVLDPVFLCDKQFYIDCAERSAAKAVETDQSFIFYLY